MKVGYTFQIKDAKLQGQLGDISGIQTAAEAVGLVVVGMTLLEDGVAIIFEGPKDVHEVADMVFAMCSEQLGMIYSSEEI